MAQANITSHVRLRNHISGYTDVIQMLTGVLLCCFCADAYGTCFECHLESEDNGLVGRIP